MRVAVSLFLLLALSGCARQWASRLSTDQIENAIELIKAQKGSACVCATAHGNYHGIAGGGTEVAGEIGSASLQTCKDVCLALRR